MISYNPKNWQRVILDLHKPDTLRRLLPVMLMLAIYSAVVAFIEIEYLKFGQSEYLKNVTILHNLLAFAISMLLVFRTNTAYDRWWEGRKQWGALVNNSRNLAVKMHTMLSADDAEDRLFFKQIIPRFAIELMNHLQSEETRFNLDEKAHPEIPDFDRRKHVPNQVATLIMSRVTQLYRLQKITGDQLIILNENVNSFLDISGACERIKNTPIPYSYSSFIKKFIFFYIVTLPIGYVFSLGYLVIPVVVLVFYVLGSLELIAEEIEDPFGKDSNDLPMQRISENIQKNVADILA